MPERLYPCPTRCYLLIDGERYSDTEILIAEFIHNPPDSTRAISALSRINYIHGIYQKDGLISNDDMLYTLALFAFGTRENGSPATNGATLPTDMELIAALSVATPLPTISLANVSRSGTFWKSVGDAMHISYDALSPSDDGLTWLANIRAWSQAYEERNMRPNAANLVVAAETTRLLLFDVPPAAHPAAKVVISALMDVARAARDGVRRSAAVAVEDG